MLYRVFPQTVDAAIDEPGGPLYVPRARQGRGRHDQPARYGAMYASRQGQSAVAEAIQAFRGRVLTDARLRRMSGRPLALAAFRDDVLERIVDLDDPAELLARGLRPSAVATRNRAVTHAVAREIFQEGAQGSVGGPRSKRRGRM
ncbi:MAG: RES domain-containing protein [Dehalococcoidia bacterium]|nr:RES domain-containing protein [Dehalococcoidia bacterium]